MNWINRYINLYLHKALFTFLLLFILPSQAEKLHHIYNKKIPLDGSWQFIANNLLANDQYKTDINTEKWSTIIVPANWYLQGHEFSGSAWYRRSFSLPKNSKKKLFKLVFEGVDYSADVWLN